MSTISEKLFLTEATFYFSGCFFCRHVHKSETANSIYDLSTKTNFTCSRAFWQALFKQNLIIIKKRFGNDVPNLQHILISNCSAVYPEIYSGCRRPFVTSNATLYIGLFPSGNDTRDSAHHSFCRSLGDTLLQDRTVAQVRWK